MVPGRKVAPAWACPEPGGSLLPSWRCPVYRWRELVAGAGMEQENLSPRSDPAVQLGVFSPPADERVDPERQKPRGAEYRGGAQGRAGP